MPEMPSRHLCYCEMQHPWHLLRDTNLFKQPHLLWHQLQTCSFSSQNGSFSNPSALLSLMVFNIDLSKEASNTHACGWDGGVA